LTQQQIDEATNDLMVAMEGLVRLTSQVTPERHTLSVTGGTKAPNTADHAIGEQVTLTATVPTGQRFVRWDITPTTVGFAAGSSATTNPSTIIIPAANVTATAVFQVNPPSGGGGGGGGGNLPRPQGGRGTSTPPADGRPAAEITLSAGSGVMAAEDTTRMVAEALENENAASVTVTLAEGVGSAAFEADAINRIQDSGLDLAVEKDGVTLVIPNANLAAHVPASANEVVVSITPLSESTINNFREGLANADDLLIVFHMTFTVDGRNITDFVNQPLLISVPNSLLGLEPGQDATGFRLNNNLSTSLFGGELRSSNFEFYTDRLSSYGVMKDVRVNRLSFAVGRNTFTANGGSPRSLEAPPFIDASTSRTLVPMRAIAEALGATVDWNYETRGATISLDGRTLTIRPDVEAVIVNNRTMVPLRYVSESLGANVVWDGSTQSISIFR
jgi:hypothetical protein